MLRGLPRNFQDFFPTNASWRLPRGSFLKTKNQLRLMAFLLLFYFLLGVSLYTHYLFVPIVVFYRKRIPFNIYFFMPYNLRLFL